MIVNHLETFIRPSRVPSTEFKATFLYRRLSSNFIPAVLLIVQKFEIEKTKLKVVISTFKFATYDKCGLSFFDFQFFDFQHFNCWN